LFSATERRRSSNLISTRSLEIKKRRGRRSAVYINDAAESTAAVHIGCGAIVHVDIFDTHSRQTIPVNPSAKRAVQWHTVEQHERATCAIRTDASE
jgi:hypothetical protein